HLDLIASDSGAPHLFALIDKSGSALGSRQLKRWLLAPLRATGEIALRQQAIRELSAVRPLRDKLRGVLSGVYDLERISGRLSAHLANPRDTLALGRSLHALTELRLYLEHFKSPLLRALDQQIESTASAVRDLATRITKTQRDDAPLVVREGGIFNPGTDPELDRLLGLTTDGQNWILELEARERKTTGISSLKIRYNRVFGYYIEITQAHLKNTPAHYQRKQTTVGAERFFTEELKKFEDEFVHASTRQKALEQVLFEQLSDAIRAQTREVMDAARLLGELDSLVALSHLGDEPGWCFPIIDDSMDLDIEAGRHPMVDQMARGEFVPNGIALSPQTRLSLIITGPNMGGKSTVMRQTALIIILGQMGAPVPATRSRWGAFSSIYTRIGAHDAIARGQSTFMVEMSELAHILHNADSRSLIVLDEIGRGTSTYDGMSVAWASLEWICNQTRARTLFATHYHELTHLAGRLPLLANGHMAVEGTRSLQGDSLRFLYELKDGAASESFGVHVARLAGLPRPVIQRAWEILDRLEKEGAELRSADFTESTQLSLFDAHVAPAPLLESEPLTPHPVLEELEKTDINEMTPMQALHLIARLQEISRESRAES
ncbi:MAG: DNA mismatch repair protein MutS, partial [Bdellovibrionota bacterium]